MNHQATQYRSLTSSIKTWVLEYKSPSRNAFLCNILSHAYRRQEPQPHNDAPLITSPINVSSEQHQPFKCSVTKSELQPIEVTTCNKSDWYLNLSTNKGKCDKPVDDINKLNTSTNTNASDSELSFTTANGSFALESKQECPSPRRTPKITSGRNYEKYAESIRHKIKFFETGIAPILKREEVRVKRGVKSRGDSPQITQIKENHLIPCPEENKVDSKPELTKEEQTSFHRAPPVITEMILKQDVIDQLRAIHEKAELRDHVMDLDVERRSKPSQDVSRIHEQILLFEQHSLNCQQNRSFSPKNNKEDEKFVVNLYERKSSKKWPRVKAAVEGGFVRVNSNLYIRDVPTAEDVKIHEISMTSSDDTITPDTSSSGLTCKRNLTVEARIHSEETGVNMDASSISRSTISALLDRSTTVSDSSVHDLNESVSSGTGLLEEVHNQCRIMQEATKAVEMCSTIKELAYGEEQLEAERILLLAGLKRSLLLHQMRQEEYEGVSKTKLSIGGARLAVSDIEFPLMLPEDHQEYKIWYIITCTCESVLQASQLIKLQRHCHFLNFTDSFIFENVSPHSVVNLKVYQVKIRNKPNNRRRTNNLCCFTKMNTCGRRSQKIQYKDLYSGMVVQSEVLPSIFTLCGNLEITIDALLNKKNFLLNSTPNDSTLFGCLKLTAHVSNISMNQNHSGFLTIGTEEKERVAWDRKWCRLEGTTLRFWDNPSEEGLNTPKVVMELKNCMEDEVKDEYFCRRHVLSLDVAGFDDKNLIMKKYFLATDARTDFKIWKKCLNSVLTSLRLWKSLGEHFDV